jgi:hypothetical protein
MCVITDEALHAIGQVYSNVSGNRSGTVTGIGFENGPDGPDEIDDNPLIVEKVAAQKHYRILFANGKVIRAG